VFKSNVNKIGILPSTLSELIPTYYVQSNSVLEDLESLRDGTLRGVDIDFLIDYTKALALLLDDTFKLGKNIVTEINNIYQ